MKVILLLTVLLFAAATVEATTTYGSSSFYATYLLTNAEYGAGAVFGGKVWFNDNGSTFRQMRLDYLAADGSTFMTEIYNYVTKDKYQVCGNQCAHATWNAAAPVFQGTVPGTYDATTCPKPDYPSYQACVSGCTGLNANPAQPQGILQLGFNSSSQLCLVRFAVPAGNTYGPEWQILTYLTSNYGSILSPLSNSTYYDPLNGLNCPQPECFAKIDIALIVDQSGSIGSAWPTVVNFTASIVQALAIGPDQAQVGLAYFSGIGDCNQNYTGTAIVSPPGCAVKGSKNGDCTKCGGLWDLKYQGTSSNKTFILSYVNAQKLQGGYTCISCGLQVGLQILQTNPRPNTPQILLLFTDGYENMVTGELPSYSAYVRSQITKILAVGVNQYVYSQLLSITGNSSYVYATSSFNQLNSLIQSFIAPLCDPLPNIASCNYCSSLCTCGTTCVCPQSCNDNNKCTNDLPCDPRPVSAGGTGGKCLYTTVVCDDKNTCTNDTCDAIQGCIYTNQTRPSGTPADSFCAFYSCQNNVGWVRNDTSTQKCGANTDMCNPQFCSDATASCKFFNASLITYNTTTTYVDSNSVTRFVQGCKKPASDPPCKVYTCNSATGGCTVDITGCKCLVDTDCNDKNGCTTDTCDTANNRCIHTSTDCYSQLSNGQCVINATFAATNQTGYNVYIGAGNNATWTNADGNGLPSPSSGTARTCDNLACFNGQRSQIYCQSTGDYTSKCVRTASSCAPNACADNICKSLGTWTNGIADTSCGAQVPVNCASSNKCLATSCNTAWTQGSSAPRCLSSDNSTNCNDHTVCTTDSCSPTTGCSNIPVNPPAANTFCTTYTCDPVTGYQRNDVSTTKCPVSNDKCQLSYCNNTNSNCASFNRSAILTTTVTTYIDANGNTINIQGCAKPAGALACAVYTCNSTTGACMVDFSGCSCTNDASCDDGNGCTIDKCNTGLNKCVYTSRDCYSELSSGTCTSVNIAAGYTVTNATGYLFYLGINATTYAGVNSSGLPATIQSRSCDNLACFNGQPSTYTCQSLSNVTSQCVRSFTKCTTGGCADNICASGSTSGPSCSVTIVPVCTGNKCLTSVCNGSYVTGDNVANRCIKTDNSSNCNDNNVCTSDSCDSVNGCSNVPISPPAANNTCYTYTCDPITGFSKNEVGSTTCGEVTSNLCNINYCDPTSFTCKNIDTSKMTYGTVQTFTDSIGNTFTVQGCQKPASDNYSCRKYVCNPSSGACTIDVSTCVCLSDAACADGSGCTVDSCDPVNNKCIRTSIDCYNELSNGLCSTNAALSLDTTTGLAVYNGGSAAAYTTVDAAGNPYPAKGVSRTCDNLGCFLGQPSTYNCLSLGYEGGHTCNRTFSTCSLNGCQDNRCQTLGTWTSGTLDANCGNVFIPNCADTSVCTNDFCNSTWDRVDPNTRCFHVPINATAVCDDGNFCTFDFCDPGSTSGDICAHYLYGEDYLKQNICKNNASCQNVSCSLNTCIYTPIVCANPSLCFAYVCNATTNNTCLTVASTLYVVDACGVCAGNGLSCVINRDVKAVGSSIAVAAGVGGGIGGLFALCAAIAAGKKSYDKYEELANESNGQVKNSGAYSGAETGGANTGLRASAMEN